jgi:hypothetical protein
MDELVILKKYGSAGGESILNYNEARQWARLERRTGCWTAAKQRLLDECQRRAVMARVRQPT